MSGDEYISHRDDPKLPASVPCLDCGRLVRTPLAYEDPDGRGFRCWRCDPEGEDLGDDAPRVEVHQLELWLSSDDRG